LHQQIPPRLGFACVPGGTFISYYIKLSSEGIADELKISEYR